MLFLAFPWRQPQTARREKARFGRVLTESKWSGELAGGGVVVGHAAALTYIAVQAVATDALQL